MASNVVSDNFETSSGGVPQLGGTGATTCKAWVNFNGTGTVAIRDSYNVSSITDNGFGDWTVNITNSMGNSNYCALVSGDTALASNWTSQIAVNTITNSSYRIEVDRYQGQYYNSSILDLPIVSSVVFGD